MSKEIHAGVQESLKGRMWCICTWPCGFQCLLQNPGGGAEWCLLSALSQDQWFFSARSLSPEWEETHLQMRYRKVRENQEG